LPGLANRFANSGRHGLGEDVPDTGRMLPENVGVDPEGYSGVGVAEPGGDQVDGDSRQQQCGRV
jgi:hypothetical protein